MGRKMPIQGAFISDFCSNMHCYPYPFLHQTCTCKHVSMPGGLHNDAFAGASSEWFVAKQGPAFGINEKKLAKPTPIEDT